MLTLFLAGVLLALAFGILAWRQTRSLPKRSAVHVLVILLLVGAALLIAFSYWGQYTLAGHRAFDEMDGLYPFVAGPFGTLLAGAAALIGWRAARRGRSAG